MSHHYFFFIPMISPVLLHVSHAPLSKERQTVLFRSFQNFYMNTSLNTALYKTVSHRFLYTALVSPKFRLPQFILTNRAKSFKYSPSSNFSTPTGYQQRRSLPRVKLHVAAVFVPSHSRLKNPARLLPLVLIDPHRGAEP